MRLLAATAIAALIATPALAQDAAAPADAPPAAAESEAAAAPSMEPASVELMGQDGTSHGTVTFTQTPNGVLLSADLTDLPDGEHGFHIHQTGTCEGDFTSAGGHYNPTEMEHGFKVEGGPHAGDMPNFTAASGTAAFDTFNPRVSMAEGEAPLNDEDGSALLIHSGADDYESQPSGDAGDRIACGVIFPAQ